MGKVEPRTGHVCSKLGRVLAMEPVRDRPGRVAGDEALPPQDACSQRAGPLCSQAGWGLLLHSSRFLPCAIPAARRLSRRLGLQDVSQAVQHPCVIDVDGDAPPRRSGRRPVQDAVPAGRRPRSRTGSLSQHRRGFARASAFRARLASLVAAGSYSISSSRGRLRCLCRNLQRHCRTREQRRARRCAAASRSRGSSSSSSSGGERRGRFCRCSTVQVRPVTFPPILRSHACRVQNCGALPPHRNDARQLHCCSRPCLYSSCGGGCCRRRGGRGRGGRALRRRVNTEARAEGEQLNCPARGRQKGSGRSLYVCLRLRPPLAAARRDSRPHLDADLSQLREAGQSAGQAQPRNEAVELVRQRPNAMQQLARGGGGEEGLEGEGGGDACRH